MLLLRSTMDNPHHGHGRSSSSQSRSLHSSPRVGSPSLSEPLLHRTLPPPAELVESLYYTESQVQSWAPGPPGLPSSSSHRHTLSTRSSNASLRRLNTYSRSPSHDPCERCLLGMKEVCDGQRPCLNCRESGLSCSGPRRHYGHGTSQQLVTRPRSRVSGRSSLSPTPHQMDTEYTERRNLITPHTQAEIEEWAGINYDIIGSLDAKSHTKRITMDDLDACANIRLLTDVILASNRQSQEHKPTSWHDVAASEPTRKIEAGPSSFGSPKLGESTRQLPRFIPSRALVGYSDDFSSLPRLCDDQEPCRERIQKLLDKLMYLNNRMLSANSDSEDLFVRNNQVKNQFIQDFDFVYGCSCSNSARVAGMVMMTCLAVLRVFEINIMGLNGKLHLKPSHATATDTEHPRALAFNTIVLPTLPATAGPSRSLASFVAANHRNVYSPTEAKVSAGVGYTWQQEKEDYARKYAYRLPQELRGPEGSPSHMQMPSLVLPPETSEAAFPELTRTLSQVWADFPRSLSHSIMADRGAEGPERIVGDLRLVAMVPQCQAKINLVIGRYRECVGVVLSRDRSGYDLEDERAALVGITMKVEERLEKVKGDMARMGSRMAMDLPTYQVV